MNEAKESSVLFSLRELMDLERRRLSDERDEEARRSEDESAKAREAAQQALAEVEARRVAEQAVARAAAERAREESAHLSAIQEAVLERSRSDAAAALALETLRVEREHERALHGLAVDKDKRRLVRLAQGLGATLFVVVAMMVGVAHGLAAPAPRLASAAELAQRETLRQVEAQLLSQREQISILEREARERPPAVAPLPLPPAPPLEKPVEKPAHVRAPKPVAPPSDAACAHEWDPICMHVP